MTVGRGPSDVVVVTGVGGMGAAIARRLGAGRQLVLADFSSQALRRVAEALRAEGHWVQDVPADISSADDVALLAKEASGLGTIRSVVHTAGVSPVQASPARIVEVDVVGTARVLDVFEEHVQPGTVAVCIASMAGTMAELPAEVERALAITPTDELQGLPILVEVSAMEEPTAAYGIAKRANQLRVEAASISWGRRGGRVLSISPGIISTPMGQDELSGPSGERMRQMIDVSATQRLGTPEDIAMAVEFLVGPAASFITGTDLLVDGGVVAALRHTR